MTEIILHLKNPEETMALGRIIGEHLRTTSLITLTGDLGTGKTCLTQGLAQGLDVPAAIPVVSPTFTLANEYTGRLPLFHLDVYRLDEAEFALTGLDEYFDRYGVTVIEWADKIQNELPAARVHITLSPAPEGGRIVKIEIFGRTYHELIPNMKTDLAVFQGYAQPTAVSN
jgi:tRNA threonylcarbamoyladenosine biosynthesis protein TsaE